MYIKKKQNKTGHLKKCIMLLSQGETFAPTKFDKGFGSTWSFVV